MFNDDTIPVYGLPVLKRAVTLVPVKTVLRVSVMKLKHQSIASAFGENRCRRYFPDQGIAFNDGLAGDNGRVGMILP